MKWLAVLISSLGTGSTLKAIIEAIRQKKLNANISVVVSDSTDSIGFQWALAAKISIFIFDEKMGKLDKLLTQKFPTDYIVLAGWKNIISEETLNAFPNKILNIHPGLIPDTINGVVQNPDGTQGIWNRGKFMKIAIQNFLDSHATYAGSSVHFLSREFDFGTVLARCFEKIQPEDTVDSLYSRLKNKEHEIYIETLKKLCNTE